MHLSLALVLLGVNLVLTREAAYPATNPPAHPALPSFPFPNPSAVPFRPTMQHRTYYTLPSPSANSIKPRPAVGTAYAVPSPAVPVRKNPTKATATTATTSTTARTSTTTTTTTTTVAPDLDTDEQDIMQFKETFKSARQLLASQLPDEAPNKELLASESEALDQKLTIALARFRFQLFDRDNDNHISVRELGGVVEKLCGKSLAPKQEYKVKQGLAKYDANGDGKLSFGEFLKMPVPLRTLPTIREGIRDKTCQSQFKMLFIIVDTNGNGYISSAELRRLGKVFIQDDTDEISDLIDSTVGVLDKDDDGQFDFDEFEDALKTVQG